MASGDSSDVFDASRDNELVLNLGKGLDYDGWGSDLYLGMEDPGNWRMNFTNQTNVYLYSITGFHRQWKVDEKLWLDFHRNIKGNFSWLVKGRLEQFHDQRARPFRDDLRLTGLQPADNGFEMVSSSAGTGYGNSDIGSRSMTVGLAYQAVGNLYASGALGPLIQERRGESFEGLRFDLDLQHDWGSGRLNGEGWLDRLNTGSDYGWNTDLNGLYAISEEWENSYRLGYDRSSQREFSAFDQIEGRRSDERINLANRLKVGIDSPLKFIWASNFTRQSTEHTGLAKEYRDHEYTWKNDLRTTIKYSSFMTSAMGGLDLQEQRYEAILIQGRRSNLGLYTIWQGSSDDSAAVDTRVIKYRFDTPDENDLNDRDELRYILSLRVGKRLMEGLGFQLELKADLNHLVYIYRPRSAENRWTRVFTLACGVPWQYGRFRNMARFTVVGNYTVYDYPPAQTELSRVYRIFSVQDTLRIGINRNWSVKLGNVLMLDEHGRFHWKDWTEDVSEDGINTSTSLLLNYNDRKLNCGIGWKLYHRYSRLHLRDGERVRGDAVRSQGPVVSIGAEPADRLQVDFRASILEVHEKSRTVYRLPDVRCVLSWKL